METEGELAGALAALQRRSPEELAAFIVSLLWGAPPGVRSYVEAFIAAAEPREVATIVRREIGTLRVGEREYDVRHRRSAEIVARASYTLGIIERVVPFCYQTQHRQCRLPSLGHVTLPGDWTL